MDDKWEELFACAINGLCAAMHPSGRVETAWDVVHLAKQVADQALTEIKRRKLTNANTDL